MKSFPLNYQCFENADADEFQGLNLQELKAPKVIKKLYHTFKKYRYKNLSKSFILSIIIVKIVQTLTSKRIKYRELENEGLSNMFVIALITSGFGKDRIIDDFDKFILKDFYLWFYAEAEKYIEQKRLK